MTCICDARFSGIDEAEFCARGCPNCYCENMTFEEKINYLAEDLVMDASAIASHLQVTGATADRWLQGLSEPHKYMQEGVIKALAELQK